MVTVPLIETTPLQFVTDPPLTAQYPGMRHTWRNPELSRLVVRYIDERRAKGELGARTAAQYRSRLLEFSESTKCRPSRIQRTHVEKWMTVRPHISPHYRRGRWSALRGFCQWCVLNGHMPADPTLGVKGPRVPESMPRSLHPAEAHKLVRLAAMDGRMLLIVLLMLQEGLRRAEVAHILVEDVDFRRRALNVRGKGGQGKPTAALPISTETWCALERYVLATGVTHGPLIRSRRNPDRGLSPSSIGELVTDLMKAAGIKTAPFDGKSAHACRHTCATDLLESGRHIHEVQRVLRHKSIANTQRYTMGAVLDLREVVEGRTYGGLNLIPGEGLAPQHQEA